MTENAPTTTTAHNRVGLAAMVLALVANIPVIAGTIILAALVLLLSGRRSVFITLGELLSAIHPAAFIALAAISLLSMILAIVAVVRGPGQRDGVTAIIVVFAVPLLSFVVFAFIALI